MTAPNHTRLRANPELASLLLLKAQLELLPFVLATVHTPCRADALADQARSMTRVSQTLAAQVRAYIRIIEHGLGKCRSERG